MRYYIAASHTAVLRPGGVGSRVDLGPRRAEPAGILHAVAVGNDQTTVCERDVFEERLKRFMEHDFEADNLTTRASRCGECAGKLGAEG